MTGAATVIRDLEEFFATTWIPTGFEYDPVTRSGLISTGPSLFRVELDGAAEPAFVGNFGAALSNLQYLPNCSE